MKNTYNLKLSLLNLAVVSAMPFAVVSNVYAACTGAIPSNNSIIVQATSAITVECAGIGAEGNISNSSTILYHDSSDQNAAGSNTLIQFDGHGRTLTNSGDIINDRTFASSVTAGAVNRTAILMGAPTVNASGTSTGTAWQTTASGTIFTTLGGAATLPSADATTIKVNTTPSASWVGQTIAVGRYDSVQGDFTNGNTRVITAVDTVNKTVTFATPLTSDFAGAGTDPVAYKIVSNYGATVSDGVNNKIVNSGTIAANINKTEITGNKTGPAGTYASISNTAALKAVTMSVEGDYQIDNSGTISVKHAGIGAAYAIEQGGAVESLLINNTGTISVERTARLGLNTGDITSVLATELKSKAVIDGNKYATQTLAFANAINTQEEAQLITLNNKKSGVLRSTGDYTGTFFSRAAEQLIVNDGLIEHLSGDTQGLTQTQIDALSNDVKYGKGYAIGSSSNGNEIRTFNLNNNGDIHGDIVAANGNPLRYYMLSALGKVASGVVTLADGINERLLINSYNGQLDSTINNTGNIIGNVWLGNGTQILNNAGTLTGDISVDQRNTYGATIPTGTSANGGVYGTKYFEFENSGEFTGSLTVRTGDGPNGSSGITSSIYLTPTITGSGVGSSLDAPSSAVAWLGTTLKIFDGTSATDGSNSTANLATVAPKLATTVHAGEYFKIANTFYGSAMPNVESASPLIQWQIAKNIGDNLVLEVDEVKSGVTLGLAANNAKVLDALMASSGQASALVQSLDSVAKIQSATEQLRPEVNGATYQASMNFTDKVFGLVGSRLDEIHLASIAGRTGVATGDETRKADGTGFWMQAFGAKGNQDRRANTDGYSTDAYGFAVGADQLIDDETRVGFVGSYGQSRVLSQGDNLGDKTSIDSYQGAIYGSTLLRKIYLNATLGLGYHDYTSNRLVLDNGIKGSHDAWQYSGKLDAGYPIKLNAVTLVPVASLAYSHLAESGYAESGVGALSIGSRDTDSFRSGLGAKALVPLFDNKVSAGLELRALWQHEFADASIDTTARFTEGGASFTTKGIDLERDSANLGASLRLFGVMDGVKQSLNMNYDAEVKSQYINQTASLQARFDF